MYFCHHIVPFRRAGDSQPNDHTTRVTTGRDVDPRVTVQSFKTCYPKFAVCSERVRHPAADQSTASVGGVEVTLSTDVFFRGGELCRDPPARVDKWNRRGVAPSFCLGLLLLLLP